MTEEKKNEKLQELDNLKLLLRFHTENRVLNVDKKFLNYVDDILDEISRIENELKNEDQK